MPTLSLYTEEDADTTTLDLTRATDGIRLWRALVSAVLGVAAAVLIMAALGTVVIVGDVVGDVLLFAMEAMQ